MPGLGTATLKGPATDRFAASNGGLWASDRLSDSRESPPSDSRDVSDILDIPSASWGCGWCSRPSCGCSLGGGRPNGSGNLQSKETRACVATLGAGGRSQFL